MMIRLHISDSVQDIAAQHDTTTRTDTLYIPRGIFAIMPSYRTLLYLINLLQVA